ncbi:MAG: magnesium transporter CorA family protein [Methanocorpusculum sp.]|nr:magnesium transporter CorA family protein [Methanocorpusculum sp.]
MMDIYLSDADGKINSVDEICDGCWIRLIEPAEDEINHVCKFLNIEKSDITILLDPEETPRVEHGSDFSLVIADTPYMITDGDIETYQTIPSGFILTPKNIVSISLRRSQVLDSFAKGAVKNISTQKRTQFILYFLYKNAGLFVNYLRMIDKKTLELEKNLRKSTRNEELFHMLTLSKSLVYITNSLKGNDTVLDKISVSTVTSSKLTDDDRELLSDTLIENSQALDMAQNYSATISSTMATFASIINNNANDTMKLFTILAILLTFPMLVAGFFGMNVPVPFSSSVHSFIMIIAVSLGLSGILLVLALHKFRKGL